MIMSFLDILKLEKTVRLKTLIETRISEFTDPSSVNKKFFQLLISSAPRKIPQDVSQCDGNQSFQNKLTDKALKSNLQVESSTIKQKIFETTHISKRYVIETLFNIFLDSKWFYYYSNDIECLNSSL